MRFVLAAPLLLLLAGCSKGVVYYLEHGEERAKRIEECRVDNGGMFYAKDCANARQAGFVANGIPAKDGVALGELKAEPAK